MSQDSQLFGETAVARGFITREQLEAALAKQEVNPDRSLGEILVGMGLITQPQATAIEKLKAALQRSGAPADDEGAGLIGLTLGGCLVLERLAEGSMGTTYRAHHMRLDRDVVVKVLHPRLMNIEGNLERFAREARAAATLEHPAIVSVYDFDTAHGYHFIVMQYVKGQDLRQVLETRGALGLRRGLWIGARVLEGLGHAHAHRIVHRDVKPANLLITPEPRVKIADFGLVRILSSSTSEEISVFGEIIGTPQYMAPEQATGDDFDHRADIYSLGVTLFELISGRPPFSGNSTLEVLEKQIVEPLPDLRELVADATPEVQAFLERLCAKAMDARFASAEEALAELQQLRFTEGATRRISATERADDPSRRADSPPIVSEDALAELKARLKRSRTFVAIEDEEGGPITADEAEAGPSTSEAMIEASFAGLEVSASAALQARQALERALAHEPEQAVPDLLHRMLEAGQVDEVLALEKQIEAHLPTSAAVAFFLGVALRRKDRLEDARAKFAVAAAFAPDHLPARLHLAQALVALGRTDEAVAALREACSWHPTSIKAAVRLAEVLYVVKGDAEGAIPAYERAIELAPSRWQLRQQLAWILYEQGRYGQAEAVLREVVAWAPEAEPARELLAQVQRKRQRQEAQRTGRRRALAEAELDGEGPGPQTSACLKAIRLAEASSKWERAIALARAGLEDKPTSLPLLLALGQAQVQAGLLSAAVDTYGRALAVDPSNEEAQRGLMETQALRRDTRRVGRPEPGE